MKTFKLFALATLLLLATNSCNIKFGGNSSSNSQFKPSYVPSGAEHAVGFIVKYKGVAIEERKRTGVPASIKLAQAILESGYGRSTLAKKANNFFGIKCGGNWSGKRYRKGSSCYRAYSNPKQGFKEHSNFLRNNSRYDFLFKLDPRDYKAWARGLKKAGYAGDPSYPSKLIELIQRYKLYYYDA